MLVVQADMSIIVYLDDPSFDQCTQTLETVADLESGDDNVRTYKISIEKLKIAGLCGLDPDPIIDVLRTHSSGVPQNVAENIQSTMSLGIEEKELQRTIETIIQSDIDNPVKHLNGLGYYTPEAVKILNANGVDTRLGEELYQEFLIPPQALLRLDNVKGIAHQSYLCTDTSFDTLVNEFVADVKEKWEWAGHLVPDDEGAIIEARYVTEPIDRRRLKDTYKRNQVNALKLLYMLSGDFLKDQTDEDDLLEFLGKSRWETKFGEVGLYPPQAVDVAEKLGHTYRDHRSSEKQYELPACFLISLSNACNVRISSTDYLGSTDYLKITPEFEKDIEKYVAEAREKFGQVSHLIPKEYRTILARWFGGGPGYVQGYFPISFVRKLVEPLVWLEKIKPK